MIEVVFGRAMLLRGPHFIIGELKCDVNQETGATTNHNVGLAGYPLPVWRENIPPKIFPHHELTHFGSIIFNSHQLPNPIECSKNPPNT